jgi:hypothetical protein
MTQWQYAIMVVTIKLTTSGKRHEEVVVAVMGGKRRNVASQEEGFARMGKAGWELVYVHPYNISKKSIVDYIFKRPVEEKPEEFTSDSEGSQG